MRVTMVFSRYRQPGGEEVSTATEAALLRKAGHSVDVVSVGSFTERLRLEADGAPDVVHVQNFFPYLRPIHFRKLHELGIPVVQSLRNYRLTCVAGSRWRDDRVCDSCTFRNPVPGVLHGCYRGSRIQTAGAATLLTVHRRRHTWTDHVSAFIAVSEHVRDLAAAALPGRPVYVKPNTVITDLDGGGGTNTVVYVGRLSREKGIVELAETWATDPHLPDLVIAGDGPERATVAAIASRATNIRLIGAVEHSDALALMGDADATVAPWRWEEPFGRSLVESLAVGTPVLAGAAALRGFAHLEPAVLPVDLTDTGQLRSRIIELSRHRSTSRAAAARCFRTHFSPEENLRRLEEIYRSVLERAD